MSEENASKIGSLVESLAKNDNLELNTAIFKEIKSLCKSSSKNISHAFYHMMTQMRKEHAEVRYIILLAMNELFLRSLEFRQLLESNLEEFLELTLETDPENPLPSPKVIADRLKLQAQAFIKSWYLKFGQKCKKLNYAYSFLNSCRKVNFDHDQQPAVHSGRGRNAAEEQNANIARQILKSKNEMSDLSPEILCTLTQVETCFQLIMPLPDNLFDVEDTFSMPSVPESENESLSKIQECSSNNLKEAQNSAENIHNTLRHHGIHHVKSSIAIEISNVSSITVEVSEDTLPVLENLKEFYHVICSKYLPCVSKWLKAFSKDKGCVALVKKAIDLKQGLENKVEKFNKLQLPSQFYSSDAGVQKDDSDSDFEEVEEKEGFELFAPDNVTSCLKPSNLLSNESPASTSGVASGSRAESGERSKPCAAQSVTFDNQDTGLRTSEKEIQKQDGKIQKIPKLGSPSTSQDVPDWQDPELLNDIKAATGIDLKLPEKKKKGEKRKHKSQQKVSARTNIKKVKDTTYARLYKKIFKR